MPAPGSNGAGRGPSRGNGAGGLAPAPEGDGLARVATARDRRLADEWLLVLAAEGIPCRLERTGGLYVVRVPLPELERAAATLVAYGSENAGATGRVRLAPRSDWRGAALVGLALLVFYVITHSPRTPWPWVEQGLADATRLCAGEPWRAVTALTLHADLGHVLANAVVGTVFLAALFGAVGPGVGLGLVVLDGALGNALNACLRAAPHLSLGASTAVFAALGLLAGIGFTRRRDPAAPARRAWVPLGGGLALLAMLGTGPRSDLGAHAFGFVAGLLSATPWLLLGPPRPAARPWQWAAGLGAGGLVVASWLAALL